MARGALVGMVLLVSACTSAAPDRVITATTTTATGGTTTTAASSTTTTESPPTAPGTTLVASTTGLLIDFADLPFDGERLVVYDGMALPIEGVGFDGGPFIIGLCRQPVVAGDNVETLCGPVAGLEILSIDDAGSFSSTLSIPQRLEFFAPEGGPSVQDDCGPDLCVLMLSRLTSEALAVWPLEFVEAPAGTAGGATIELTLDGEPVGPNGLEVGNGRFAELVVIGLGNENVATFAICPERYQPGALVDGQCAPLAGIDEQGLVAFPAEELNGTIVETVFRREIVVNFGLPEGEGANVDCGEIPCWLHVVDVLTQPQLQITALANYPLRFS